MFRISKALLIIVIISYITAMIAYFYLPEQIPTHWNLQGQADQWGNRWNIFFMPILISVLLIVFFVTKKIDPQHSNYQKFQSAYTSIQIAIALFMFAMQIMTMIVALHPNIIQASTFINMGIGILFCVLGNLMPKVRANYFIGIKTPWTLRDEDVWRRTHRISGKLWFFGGFLFIIASLLPNRYGAIVLFMILLILVGIPTIYSYGMFLKKERGERI